MIRKPGGKRLLLWNPNTSRKVTTRIAGAATAVASPGIELVPLTPAWGVPCIASRAEVLPALALLKPRLGTFRRPDRKPTSGLAPALAAWIEHRDGPEFRM